MNGSTSSQSWKTEDSHSVQGPEQWMKSTGQSLFNAAQAEKDAGYQQYGGERVADYGADWQKSRDAIAGLTDPSADLNSARSYLTQLMGASGNDPNKSVSDYVNPYVGGVLAPTLRNLDEARQRTGMADGFAATMSGAYGDAQQGVATALGNRDYMNAVSDATNKTYADAWNQGQQQQNTVLSRLMAIPGMFQSIGNQADSRTLQGASALNSLATQARDVQQAKDNVGYSDFVANRDYATNKASQLMELLNATPHDTITDQHKTSYGKEEKEDNSALGGLGSLLTKGLGSIFGGGSGGFGSAGAGALLSAI